MFKKSNENSVKSVKMQKENEEREVCKMNNRVKE